jgi:hypothetical protein
MPKVPDYRKIYKNLIEKGTDPAVASAQAHAAVYYYNKQYRDEGETESDEEDETDPRSIISRDLGKMKLHLAQLLNKYKQDKTLPKVIKYLAEMQNKT